MGDVAVEVTLSIRAEHAEGPLWDAATARLWWVDITGQRVHCFDPATGNHSSWGTAGQPGGVVLTICNGPAFDELQGRLYLADTAIFVVDVFDLDPVTGALAGRRRFRDFGDAQVWPDGMTVDDEGMLWLALGRAGAVHRYRPDGTLDGMIELPATNPTSVALGGADRGDLYITTSWFDLEPDSRAAQPLAGVIFRCRAGVTGPPSPRYADVPASSERASDVRRLEKGGIS